MGNDLPARLPVWLSGYGWPSVWRRLVPDSSPAAGTHQDLGELAVRGGLIQGDVALPRLPHALMRVKAVLVAAGMSSEQ